MTTTDAPVVARRSRAKVPPEIAWVKSVTFQVDQPLLDALVAHRKRLDAKRPEGASLTSMGDAVRNLLLAGLARVE